MVRFLHATHDLAADALGVARPHGTAEVEALIRIELGVRRSHRKTAARDDADATPVAIRNFEHLLDDAARMDVAVRLHGPRIRILDLGPT